MVTNSNSSPLGSTPTVLVIPGEQPVPGQSFLGAPWGHRQVNLGMWDNPHRNTWVNKLNLEIDRADQPVILVASGLACLAVVWWAEYERPAFGVPVAGALLVSPPDVDRPGLDPRLARFGACPRQPLPFPSFLVGNGTEAAETRNVYRSLARDWGSRYSESVGFEGGIPKGRSPLDAILKQLLREHALRRVPQPGEPHAGFVREFRGAATKQ